jgi:hypothetical protein
MIWNFYEGLAKVEIKDSSESFSTKKGYINDRISDLSADIDNQRFIRQWFCLDHSLNKFIEDRFFP